MNKRKLVTDRIQEKSPEIKDFLGSNLHITMEPNLLEQEKISAADIRQLNPQTKIEIEQRTTSCGGGLRERIHWLQRGFHTYPICEQCQQPLSSKNFRINYFYFS